MAEDPERYSIDFRGVLRVPVATVKTFHRLKTVELNRLKLALEAELAARRTPPYKPGYPVVGYNATEAEAAAVSTAPRTIAEPQEAPIFDVRRMAEELSQWLWPREYHAPVDATVEDIVAWLSTALAPTSVFVKADTQTGLDRAPDRYMSHGRETIDRMRDLCWKLALDRTPTAAVPVAERADVLGAQARYASVQKADQEHRARSLADLLFVTFCRLQAMKYRDRHGLKEGVDPARDEQAAYFYETLAAHVESGGEVPDPRHQRPDFTPYERQDWQE